MLVLYLSTKRKLKFLRNKLTSPKIFHRKYPTSNPKLTGIHSKESNDLKPRAKINNGNKLINDRDIVIKDLKTTVINIFKKRGFKKENFIRELESTTKNIQLKL